MIARIIIWCSQEWLSKLSRLCLMVNYLISWMYFGCNVTNHSIDYLKAMYWRSYKFTGFASLVNDRTPVQVAAWIIIAINVQLVLEIVLYGLVSFVKQHW